ncbi:MAG: hypothetical protein AB7S77_16765, partial [Desulfatirhabdiaceae bacterium]
MNRRHSRSGLFPGIQKLSDTDPDEEAGKNTAAAKILQTREIRQTLSGILPDVLTVFAKDSKIGNFIMKSAGNYLTKLLARPRDIFEDKELHL